MLRFWDTFTEKLRFEFRDKNQVICDAKNLALEEQLHFQSKFY